MSRSASIWTITLIFVGLAGASVAQAGPSWVSTDGSPGAQKPVATLLNSNGNETVIKFTVPGFSSEVVSLNGKTYQSLRFPGHFTTTEIGQPQLPVISEFVAIPADTDVRVSVIEFAETTLSGYNIQPYQRPTYEGEQAHMVEIDDALYQTNAFYPDRLAQIGETGVWRHISVVNLVVNPIRYNPATGELKVITDVTVKLEYSTSSNIDTRMSTGRMISRNYDDMYRRSVLNYDWLGLPVEDTQESASTGGKGYEYLIITAGQYATHLEPLVAWKNSLGLRTEVVPISRVGSDTAAIRTFIADEYFNNDIEYVLLVGNETEIPGYEEYRTEDREDTIFCDYYYSVIDGDDDFADLAIGRFSVDDPVQVVNMVNKTIAYESNPDRGDWLDNVLLVANQENAPDKYQACSEEIRTAQSTSNHTYDVLYPEFTTAYGSFFERGGDEATNADVISAVNHGQRVVNYRGHGADNYWSYWNIFGECFTNDEASQINTAGDLLTPVVFSIACWNGNLRAQEPCLGEAFTRGEDQAVAFLGASIPSYTEVNHEYNKSIFEIIFNDGVNTIGNATNQASIEMIRRYHEDAVQNARGYLWLGDPSLNVIFYGEPGPEAPVLCSPEDGANYVSPAQPVLVWDEVSGATSYEVMIDDAADFLTTVAGADSLVNSEWTVPSLETGRYYWRVRAISNNIVGGWSEVRILNVGIPTPVLYSPADVSTIDNDDSVALVWHDIAGVNSFLLQVDDNPLFGSPDVDLRVNECSETFCIYYINPRLAAGTYFWRVKGDGPGMDWSAVWQFTIEPTVGDIAMHIADMDVYCFIDEKVRYTGACSVLVVDQAENPVSGVNVECYWKKYQFDGTLQGITNERGIAYLVTKDINDIYAPFCFTVTEVSLVGAVYDSTANLVTRACESGWVIKEIASEPGLPGKFSLSQNYPNPFNPVTEIQFSLAEGCQVRLEVYNIAGQKVSTLVDGRLEAGNHTVSFDGSKVASGVYLYRLMAGDFIESRKMMLVK